MPSGHRPAAIWPKEKMNHDRHTCRCRPQAVRLKTRLVRCRRTDPAQRSRRLPGDPTGTFGLADRQVDTWGPACKGAVVAVGLVASQEVHPRRQSRRRNRALGLGIKRYREGRLFLLAFLFGPIGLVGTTLLRASHSPAAEGMGTR